MNTTFTANHPMSYYTMVVKDIELKRNLETDCYCCDLLSRIMYLKVSVAVAVVAVVVVPVAVVVVVFVAVRVPVMAIMEACYSSTSWKRIKVECYYRDSFEKLAG